MSRRRLPPQIAVDVVDLDRRTMLGVTMYAERSVLVKGALPGERVAANVITKSRGAFRAVADQVHRASYQRRDAPCAIAPRCGGCSLQHVAATHQVELKKQALELELRRARLRTPPIGVIATPKELGYRRRARLGVRHLPKTRETLVGFRESFGSYVVRMDRCLTLTPRLGRLVAPLGEAIAALEDPRLVPQIELAEGDTVAAVVIRHVDALTDHDVAILRRFAREQWVRVYLQPGDLDSVALLASPDGSTAPLSYQLDGFGLDLEFAPTDFLQVNGAANEMLVDRVVAEVDRIATDVDRIATEEKRATSRRLRVVDLFCGLGNFSLPLARRGSFVRGVDFSSASIDRAVGNRDRNGVRDATFRAANLYVDDVVDWLGEFDVAVLDPPRSGIGERLRSAAADWPRYCRKIVYVSCNPITFADDVAVLTRYGYRLDSVDVIDMFPQTSHVETFGVLTHG